MTIVNASNARLYQQKVQRSIALTGESAVAPSRPLVDLLQDMTIAGDKRATVARFASRFFVLVSERGAPRSAADVRGPYDTVQEAARRARMLQHRSFTGAESA